jgi:hypothetical protein
MEKCIEELKIENVKGIGCSDRTPKRRWQGQLLRELDQESIMVTYSVPSVSIRREQGNQLDALKAMAWNLSNDLNLIVELINDLEK